MTHQHDGTTVGCPECDAVWLEKNRDSIMRLVQLQFAPLLGGMWAEDLVRKIRREG